MNHEILSYTYDVMIGRPATKEAPPFGQRLAAARKAKGWSQTELAVKLDTTLKMIDYYERRANNPAMGFVQQAAKALGMSVDELLGNENVKSSKRKKPGPAPVLERKLEEIRRLPRKDQEFVLKFLDTVIERAKAS